MKQKTERVREIVSKIDASTNPSEKKAAVQALKVASAEQKKASDVATTAHI